MNSDFARAMRRASASVRAQDPAAATAIIQAALAGRPLPDDAKAAPGRAFHLDPQVEDAEVVPAADTGPRRGLRMRRRLGEVIRLLREGRSAMGEGGLGLAADRAPAPEPPDGASFVWRSHADAAGTRRYRLFVPSCDRSELRGLVLMLHGCKQDPDDFAAGTGMNALAERERLVVAYPGQTARANVSSCWNWFNPAHQSRDAGEPAILASLTRALAAEFGVPPQRTFVAGLSAGGAMAAVMAATHPELFAAAGIHSGLAYGSANDVASAFVAMRGQPSARSGAAAPGGPRLIVFHGTGDKTVHPSNAQDILAASPAGVSQRSRR